MAPPPLAFVAELPVSVLLLTVSVPLLKTPPPPWSPLPFSMVTPEMVTVAPEHGGGLDKHEPFEKTRTAPPPLIAKLDAPGPLIVKFVLIASVLLSVIVAGNVRLKLIVSPDAALAIAPRSEPGPLSFVLVTAIVFPKTCEQVRTTRQATTRPPGSNCFISTDSSD